MTSIEKDISQIKQTLEWLIWIGGSLITIALALVANLISSFVIH